MDVVVSADTVEVHVRDEGEGLSVADRARALERLWRGDAVVRLPALVAVRSP